MPQNPASFTATKAGTAQPGRLGLQNDLLQSARHAANYTAALAAGLMLGGNATGATTSVGLAPTYTGLVLSNPAASGKNLALIRVAGALNVAPAALTTFRLLGGFAAAGIVTHTTPLVPVNAFLGGAAPVAKLDAAATLVGTPGWLLNLGETPGATSVVSFAVTLDGAIIIPPGGYVAIGTDIAGPAAGLFASMLWEEITL